MQKMLLNLLALKRTSLGQSNHVFLHFSRHNTSFVFSLRSEGDPYIGLVDCAKRIVDEEGWKVLYRAWWMTLLGGVASIFV